MEKVLNIPTTLPYIDLNMEKTPDTLDTLNTLNKFLKSIGAECKKEPFHDTENGYQYDCWYQYYKHFTLYLSGKDVYIQMNIENKMKPLLTKLSQTFNINLDKLKFYEIHFNMFKLQNLPNEIINLTTDDDTVYLYSENYMAIKDKAYLTFNNKKITFLEIKDWDLYNKVKDYIDQDMRKVLDKLSTSRPEFRLEGNYDKLTEDKIKTALSFLEKLTTTANRIIIDVEEKKAILNDIVLNLENWGVNIPNDVIEKIVKANTSAFFEIHEDFWFIKVYHSYLQEVTNTLTINPVLVIDPKKTSTLPINNKGYYIFSTSNYDHLYQYHIVPSEYVEKYLQLIGVKPPKQTSESDSFEINHYKTNYLITKGEEDEIHVQVIENNEILTSLRTYLWYFGVKNFSDLKTLDKEKIVTVINRQLNERYFYPMPYDEVKQYVIRLIDNTIQRINEAIDNVKEKITDFTKPIKNTDTIVCIFDKKCKVSLELDEIDKPSSYYSLIATSKGHLPIPIFLEYAETEGSSDEENINITKNILYFIRGYEEEIPEGERDQPDYVRGAPSELFQKAIVLYNKLHHSDINDCPENTLPDGIGYCRNFDYEPLMQKSEEELAKEITEELTKIREKMINIREKITTQLFS